MYDMSYAGVSASEKGVYIERRPSIPAPEEKIEKITIPGRDGDLIVREGVWKDIEIPVSLAFRATDPTNWFAIWRSMKAWLRGSGKLSFSDDGVFFYKVKYIELSDAEREIRKHGRFTANFVCEPYQYERAATEWINLPTDGILGNPYSIPSHPVYKIIGEGVCVLTVNAYELQANVGQNLVIDTERQLSYRMDGTPQNTMVTGDYTKLHLQTGDNNIAVTEGFDLQIQPCWRDV